MSALSQITATAAMLAMVACFAAGFYVGHEACGGDENNND